jgi:hypothetical protein
VYRISSAGRQQTVGQFVARNVEEGTEPGQYIESISVEDGWYSQLYVNDQPVGSQWTRDTSQLQDEPRFWKIEVTAPSALREIGYECQPNCYPIYTNNVPRYLTVTTKAGIRIRTPLVWWTFVSATAGLGYNHPVCPDQGCYYTGASGRLFYGDGDREGRDTSPMIEQIPAGAAHTAVGFIPVGAGGRGVGHTTADWIFVTLGLDAQTIVWNKSYFQYYTRTDSLEDPPAISPAPSVGVKRDYLPHQLELYRKLNIAPPDYTIAMQ